MNLMESDPNGMNEIKMFYHRKALYEIRVECATWIENAIQADPSAEQFYHGLKNYIRSTFYDRPHVLSSMFCSIKQLTPSVLYNHFLDGMAMEVYILARNGEDEENTHQTIQGLVRACDTFYQVLNDHNIADPVLYLENFFSAYVGCQNSVLNKLSTWKIEQKQSNWYEEKEKEKENNNTKPIHPLTIKLNQIQSSVELLLEISFRMPQMIESVRMRLVNGDDIRLQYLAKNIQVKQSNLLVNSFIVDNQPNQVIKTGTNFSASVRWLIGTQLGFDNNNFSFSKVQCTVVSENHARKLDKERLIEHAIDSSSKEMTGNVADLEYRKENHIYSANFKVLNIKKIQRSDRKGTSDSVMDEKLALLFQMTVKLNNNTSFTISTLSQPIVVIVHGNQEHQAWATIMWDNAFAAVDRPLFVVPEIVTWKQLSDALCFKCYTETKRGLTDSNRYFLYEKFYPNCNIPLLQRDEVEFKWSLFCKETINASLTFWEWYYFTLKLIKERLFGPWNDNLIEGFISKRATEEKLQFQLPGTFILRFSDSVKGAITISYVTPYFEVNHIQPWTIKDLQTRCLADRIKDLRALTKPYGHEVDKSKLFYTYCSRDEPRVLNGYVPGITITTISSRDEPLRDEGIARIEGNMIAEDDCPDVELDNSNNNLENFNFDFDGFYYDKSHQND